MLFITIIVCFTSIMVVVVVVVVVDRVVINVLLAFLENLENSFSEFKLPLTGQGNGASQKNWRR